MKSKKELLRPVTPSPPTLPGASPLLMLIDIPKSLSRPDKTICHPTNSAHRVREPRRPSDRRPDVAATGDMGRVRARLPEFHKKAADPAAPATAPRPRKIRGGLVARRRAGK